MGDFLSWIVARRLLTLVGFGVILLGAFIPWPSLAIAAVVIVLGAVLLAVQIPIAMRDATEQLDGFDEPEEQSQSPSYPQYQAPAFQPDTYSPQQYQQPQPVTAPAPAWQPSNIPQSPQPGTVAQPEPYRHVDAPAAVAEAASVAAPQQPAPSRPTYEPAPVWQPKNIPPSVEPLPAPSPRMYEPAPVWQPQTVRKSQETEPSPESEQPTPAWKVGEPAPAWRPKNIPQP